MTLAFSLAKDILHSSAGIIINRFKAGERRIVLFPENILAEYIKICDNEKYGEELFGITIKWSDTICREIIPRSIREIASELIINLVVGQTWVNLGIVDDFKAKISDKKIDIEVSNCAIIRLIGLNSFSRGILEGNLTNILGQDLELEKEELNGKIAKCTFTKKGNLEAAVREEKRKALKTNPCQKTGGINLKEAVEKNIFTLDARNKIMFRGKILLPLESTIFHMLGGCNILLDKIPAISTNFFNEIIDKTAPLEKKLVLLKSLLQAMGWGTPTITIYGDEISIRISNAPESLLAEKENHVFFAKTIEGYMRSVEENLQAVEYTENEGGFSIYFKPAKGS